MYSNAGFRKNYDYPDIDQLHAITDSASIFNIRIGNPLLKNTINNNSFMYTSFNSQNPKSPLSYNGSFNINFVKSKNPIVDSVLNDLSGRRTYYYVNASNSRNMNMYYNFNISRRIKKSSIQLMYNGSMSSNNIPTYIDQLVSNTKTKNINNSLNLQLDLRSVVILTIGKTYNNYTTSQSSASLNSFKSFSDITKFGMTLNLPKSITISSTLDHTRNSNLSSPMILWNAFASYRFLKNDQAELKISAMDMLKQFKNISNSANIYGTSTRITNGLQQYFMVTFSFFPRKFGKATKDANAMDIIAF